MLCSVQPERGQLTRGGGHRFPYWPHTERLVPRFGQTILKPSILSLTGGTPKRSGSTFKSSLFLLQGSTDPPGSSNKPCMVQSTEHVEEMPNAGAKQWKGASEGACLGMWLRRHDRPRTELKCHLQMFPSRSGSFGQVRSVLTLLCFS